MERNLPEFDKKQAIQDINQFCSPYVEDWTDCLYLAKEMYDNHFILEIKQLLYCYPENHTVNGQLFWSNGKRCPKVIDHYFYKS